MFKGIFPKRSPKVVLEHRTERAGSGLPEQATSGNGDDETINQFCFRHEKKLDKESLRLVILAESEKRILFDSETVLPVNTPGVPAKAPLSNCGRFQMSSRRPGPAGDWF
ncbi:unnamed protein product [Gongylonema pulchrum]|uniref:Uncharacterized protein n=1 Tax=Gongylonema pulchrum TaxID=637853 RepID=A0A183E8G0_9BILA|nr:unnamed protein product [Gongylonema pulchrum]